MTRRRFIDVLNWGGLVAPGVMSCKDGSFLAGWELAGIDTESLEPDALAGRLGHVAGAISELKDGEADLGRLRAAPVGSGLGAMEHGPGRGGPGDAGIARASRGGRHDLERQAAAVLWLAPGNPGAA